MLNLNMLNSYDLIIENATILMTDADNTVVTDGVIGIKDGNIALLQKQIPGVRYHREKSRHHPV